MRAAPLLALTLALAVVATGCLGTPPPAEEPAHAAGGEPGRSAPDAEGAGGNLTDTGALVVTARMPDLAPIPGVTITLGDRTALTGADGTARFDTLAPGAYNLTARKEAHRTAQLGVTIAAGAETTADVILAPASDDQHAHEGGALAHRDLYRFEGRFDCSATYVIITGDCLLLVDNVTNATGAPVTPGDATEERHLIDFPLDLGWTTLVAEQVWDASLPALGEGMTLALEPAEAPADGHAAKYARATGGSPLRVRLEAGEKHENATAEDMPNPLGGEVIRARSYVTGLAHNPGGTSFLGVGATHDHRFTLYVSIFYGEKPDPTYTALGGN